MTTAAPGSAYCRRVDDCRKRPDVWQLGRGLLLLAFVLVGTAGAARGDHGALHDMDALGYVLAFAGAAPFVTAPTWPLPSLAVTSVAVSAYLAIGYTFGPVLIALGLVGVIAAASTPSSRTVAVLVPFVAVLTAALTVRFARDDDTSAWLGLLGIGWFAVPWAIGTFIRFRAEGRRSSRREEAARAVHEERMRIAAEVHDVAGHGLAVIAMQAGVALHVLERRPEHARIALEEIRAASTEALDGLRASLASFRTADADAPLTPGLPGIGDLPALADRIRSAGVDVELQVQGDPARAPAVLGHAAYRVVQESLTNVLRHSGATRAMVHVRADNSEVIVSVRDNGTGQPGPEGNGIAGMRDRVRARNGVFRAGPGTAGGFEVEAVWTAGSNWPAEARA